MSRLFLKIQSLLFLICLLNCTNNPKSTDFKKADAHYFSAISNNDIRLSAPKEGEWLYEHKEPGQTVEQYKKQWHRQVGDILNTIYLRPIGQFNSLQQKALEETRLYLSLFFQTNTVLLPSIPDNIIPFNKRRIREDKNEQLLAPYLLDSVLNNNAPDNSVALMAITAKDIYPKDAWNYVFGLASYEQGIGVTSMYRLEDRNLNTTNYTKCLRRLINVSSHEIGHMLGLMHCIYAKCIMNGSNSLYETDKEPNRLCSQCQEKLFWNIKYDNRKRLKELTDFFSSYNLVNDYHYLKIDEDAL